MSVSGGYESRQSVIGTFAPLFFKSIEVETKFPFSNSIAEFSRGQDPMHTSRLIRSPHQRGVDGNAKIAARCRRNSRCYLILATHSFRRSSSERTWVSMVSCNASVPLLANSAEAFLSRFCFQSRIACLVALWVSAVALRYAFMQASAIAQVLHS